MRMRLLFAMLVAAAIISGFVYMWYPKRYTEVDCDAQGMDLHIPCLFDSCSDDVVISGRL